VDELGHVVNFDVPRAPDDYIHRVGRTGRADATGEAFTFVAPDEEDDMRAIERASGSRLPRVTLPDFDYTASPRQTLEVPFAQRIAAIRARKREDRARADVNAARRAATARGASGTRRESPPASHPPHQNRPPHLGARGAGGTPRDTHRRGRRRGRPSRG
jgi:ATP-dependent RNA helicase RhlE